MPLTSNVRPHEAIMTTYRLRNWDELHEFDSLEAAQAFLDKLDRRAGIEFVDVPNLFRLTNEVGAPLTTWREIIGEIDTEFSSTESAERRSALLALFKSTMDFVEARLPSENVDAFRDARTKHYKIFIAQECTVNGHICVETLDEITRREIAAGRMTADDRLRQIAEQGMAEPHLSRAELLQMPPETFAPRSRWQRLLKWLKLG